MARILAAEEEAERGEELCYQPLGKNRTRLWERRVERIRIRGNGARIFQKARAFQSSYIPNGSDWVKIQFFPQTETIGVALTRASADLKLARFDKNHLEKVQVGSFRFLGFSVFLSALIRPFNKGKLLEVSYPFCFDFINQLANIPATITLYELLQLPKSTKEALREAFVDAEVFVTQLPTDLLTNEAQSLNIFQTSISIVFVSKDIQV